jgi:hypothetical protein
MCGSGADCGAHYPARASIVKFVSRQGQPLCISSGICADSAILEIKGIAYPLVCILYFETQQSNQATQQHDADEAGKHEQKNLADRG